VLKLKNVLLETMTKTTTSTHGTAAMLVLAQCVLRDRDRDRDRDRNKKQILFKASLTSLSTSLIPKWQSDEKGSS
jgi:hypothetical protein